MVTSQEKKRPVLICWFDALPRASAGSFHYLESAWKQKVIFLVMHDMDEAHRKIGWKDHIYPNEVIVLSRESNPDQKVQSLLAKYPDAIHYMNGFRSATRKYLYDFLLPNKLRQICLLPINKSAVFYLLAINKSATYIPAILSKRSLGDHVMGNRWTWDEQPLLMKRATSAQTNIHNLGNTLSLFLQVLQT